VVIVDGSYPVEMVGGESRWIGGMCEFRNFEVRLTGELQLDISQYVVQRGVLPKTVTMPSVPPQHH